MNSTQLAAGVGLAALVSAAARRARALSPTGAWAAWVVGSLTFGIGGITPAVLLLIFFISSSLLSRLGSARKAAVAAAFDKGGERDAGQVLANGALAAIAAVGYGWTSHPGWLVAIAGSLAAANADTWATELGVLSLTWPRRILGGHQVEPGTSGAVSGRGLLAALAGSAVVGLAAAALESDLRLALAATVGGFAGAMVDSLLGATVQAIYWCPVCKKETERHPLHSCGATTFRLRGVPWLSNDGVNFAATLTGTTAAVLLYALL